MKLHFTFILALLISTLGFGQQKGLVTGMVTDTNKEPLTGVNIFVPSTSTGTITDIDGKYELSLNPGTHVVTFTYTGHTDQEKTITVNLEETTILDITLDEGINLDVVVVSGSRRAEKLTESPATIETIFAEAISQHAGNPAELLARKKGIDYFRSGVAGVGINVRGFANNFNSKNLLVTDGRFSTLPATGLPFGSFNTTVKEDIDHFEVILGPNSTLYGPNAHNGLLNIITKDPRKHQGTTFVVGAGNQSTLSFRARHAQVLSDKLAFKVVAEYTQAEEFEYADSVYMSLDGIPGNETAKEEFDLDRDIDFIRTEASLHYTPTDKTKIIFNTGFSNSNMLTPTNVGRNQIIDWQIFYGQLQLKTGDWFAQVSYNGSYTDETFSHDDRTKQYWYGRTFFGMTDEEASSPDWLYSGGALFKDDSRRINAEVQYSKNIGKLELATGLQWQQDQANSLGTYLFDGGGDDPIVLNQMGGYVHLTQKFSNGWKAIAGARADNHELYGFNFIPKLGILKIGDIGTWRLTYGQGIAAPTIFNQFSNVFNGLIMGNAEGFTLLDGTKIERQRVEKLQTIELGYRGQLVKSKLFMDANAYYNISKDFLSPVTSIGFASHRGDTPIEDLQAAYSTYNGLILTYVNFGEFNTYGFDFGLNYYITPKVGLVLNYSHFGYNIDEKDLDNDFNNDGILNELDLLINSPRNKVGLGINYNGDKFFANTYVRHVEAFNYFSGFQIAAATDTDLTWRGVPIEADARGADAYNYGPLGDFVDVSIGFGYKFNDVFTATASITNLFDSEIREATAGPPTGRLFGVELRIDLPAIKNK